ncbi:hypothetical protein TRFO_37011 [Tritrichomonas foetus]|uniref:Uncharacterized protein n=1 Tax=Tritrichomonas foetus TaxID=1144522 RepID=A0A1J4JEN8_9EUKA|nr:hypothetical protein TRFO_37011 [Tritrichomonas foetus]|eukprot:OHS96759.1 hypothetical protein TRFO_37011 [Tritrichomonas foetus]
MNNMESTSFIFEPINSECAAFMNLLPPGSQIGQAAIKNTNKIITKLDKVFISLFTKKDKTTKNPLKNIASQSPKVKYANNKIHILVNHIQKETENLKNNAQNLELQVICFLTQCKESNLSVAFQINEFMYHLKKNYKKNDYIIKAKKKINYLEKFIEFNIQRKTSIDLKIEISKYTNNYRLDDEYFPINDFDYIIHQKYDHKIEAVVNQIIGDTPESIDSLNSIKNDSTSDSLIAYNS